MPSRCPHRLRRVAYRLATYEVRLVEWKPGWNVRDGLAFSRWLKLGSWRGRPARAERHEDVGASSKTIGVMWGQGATRPSPYAG
jgi:hypothetical protein